jgi:hypothetical protein
VALRFLLLSASHGFPMMSDCGHYVSLMRSTEQSSHTFSRVK